MFNLGIAHLYGYANRGVSGTRDPQLAGQWFEASGLPEGFFAASLYYDMLGDNEAAAQWRQRAANMGHGTFWRKEARDRTGSGGAGGVDLNMAWPPLPGGQHPPQW